MQLQLLVLPLLGGSWSSRLMSAMDGVVATFCTVVFST